MKIVFIALLMVIATVYSELLIEYFYDKTFYGSRHLFRYPFWDWGTAFIASVFALFLVEGFKQNCDYMALFIALNIYLMLWSIRFYLYYYLHLNIPDTYYVDMILYVYTKKETLILSVNFLTIVFLRAENKRRCIGV